MAKYKIYSFPDGSSPLVFSSLETFGLSYDIQWDSVNVYGRQDAIQSYKATGQTLNFSFPYAPNTGDTDDGSLELQQFLKILNSLTRPIYKNNIIETSPLVVLDFGSLKNSFYTDQKVIFAPTTINLDYGDKARLISRSIQGASNPANDGEIFGSALPVQPNKIIVSFSGPIIHVGQQYATRTTTVTRTGVASEGEIADAAARNITQPVPIP